ncbi:MAG TPA: MATE family efflux transporter [Quisquiliibacterium sp.]|nr:MATE family efflux transporter [Quisquiliibacterium sp.]
MRKDILRLAWPVFVGQLAVMLNGVIDTVMAGRLSATDMAAIGVGVSIYITVYIGLMGTLLGLSPIVAQHYGAGRNSEIGASFQQAVWLSALLSVPGCAALAWTDPWLALAAPPGEVSELVRGYLWAVAAGLPPALLFRAFYALNTAISRPQVVMYINLVGVALKVPLNALFMYGWEDAGLPALGGAGCGVATSVIAWVSAVLAGLWLVLDREYERFRLLQRSRPDRRRMGELLRLGLPIGAAYTVEITSFTFMALFLARLGATASASHQVAANLTGICYMGGLGLASATSTLVAQSIGAGDHERARRYAITGLRLALGLALATAAVLLTARLPIAHAYTSDLDVVRASLPLIAAVAVFHVFDSMQTQFGFILRAYKIATLPMVVYVLAMWAVGLGGGWWLTFGTSPEGVLGALNGERAGALGFWVAGTVGLVAATIGLGLLTVRRWREESPDPPGTAR